MTHTSLVTGASKGIGAAITQALSLAGADVVAHYNTGAPPAGSNIEAVQGDLARPGEPERIWAAATRGSRRINSLVCNAGIMPAIDPGLGQNDWEAAWERIWRVNVVQTADLLRLAAPAMAAWGGGSIAVMSSNVMHRGSSREALAPYAATKAAVAALAKTYARAYADQNVQLHIIAPGGVRTDMPVTFLKSIGLEGEALQAAHAAMADPVEVGEIIAQLILSARPSLSGATIDMSTAEYIR